jgi:hypothetical protein
MALTVLDLEPMAPPYFIAGEFATRPLTPHEPQSGEHDQAADLVDRPQLLVEPVWAAQRFRARDLDCRAMKESQSGKHTLRPGRGQSSCQALARA